MIKALGTDAEGKAQSIIIGLDRENTNRLHDNKPIGFYLNELSPELPNLFVVLLAGETLADVRTDLRALAPIREWRNG